MLIGGDKMYCSLCQRIINIRKNQGKNYFDDLCSECKKEYIKWNNIDRKIENENIIVTQILENEQSL